MPLVPWRDVEQLVRLTIAREGVDVNVVLLYVANLTSNTVIWLEAYRMKVADRASITYRNGDDFVLVWLGDILVWHGLAWSGLVSSKWLRGKKT
jgi:hypothetical protein